MFVHLKNSGVVLFFFLLLYYIIAMVSGYRVFCVLSYKPKSKKAQPNFFLSSFDRQQVWRKWLLSIIPAQSLIICIIQFNTSLGQVCLNA